MSSPLGYPVGYRWWHLCVVNIPHGGDELSFHNYISTTLNFMYDVIFHIQNYGDFTGVKKYVYYLYILREVLQSMGGGMVILFLVWVLETLSKIWHNLAF